MQKQTVNHGEGSQTLDQYISKLMTDDDALKAFLSDPTNGGAEYGITKAERAVLRRVLAHLSNNSKNGYGIARQMDSYRRSLRLLQNVLHRHSAIHTAMVASSDDETYHIRIYFTGDFSSPGAPYSDPAKAYQTYVSYTESGSFSTLGEAMQFNNAPAKSNGKIFTVQLNKSVTDKNGASGTLKEYNAICLPDPLNGNQLEWYMLSFELEGFTDSAFPNINGTYVLPYKNVQERDPFWYFSLNGQAISPTSKQGYNYFLTDNVTQGDNAESFVDFQLNGSTQIDWQPIAADMDYGFAPCFQTEDTPILLGIPVLNQLAPPNPPTQFYTKTTSNVVIPEGKTIMLAANPDGTGKVYVDDGVFITVGGKTVYEHDYSGGCSGVVTPTDPVDVTSNFQPYVGQTITIVTTYKDLCGAFESSSGYFLVFK